MIERTFKRDGCTVVFKCAADALRVGALDVSQHKFNRLAIDP